MHIKMRKLLFFNNKKKLPIYDRRHENCIPCDLVIYIMEIYVDIARIYL